MLSTENRANVSHFEIEWNVTNKVPVYPTDPDYDQYDEIETATSYDNNVPVEDTSE